MIIVPGSILISILDYSLTTYLPGLVLRLFQNNFTPTQASVISDFTEATFDGYAPITMSPWPYAAVISNEAVVDQPLALWIKTGSVTSNTIYGYYVTDGGGYLMYSDRSNLVGGVAMDAIGKTYAVKPRFGLKAQS